MKIKEKMWCLINKNTGRIIKIATTDSPFLIGVATKEGLLDILEIETTKDLEYDQEIRKIEFII